MAKFENRMKGADLAEEILKSKNLENRDVVEVISACCWIIAVAYESCDIAVRLGKTIDDYGEDVSTTIRNMIRGK